MIPSLKKLEVILNNVADGVTVQDVTGKLVYANKEAARLLGFNTTTGLLSASLQDILSQYELKDEDGNEVPLSKLPGRRALKGKNEKTILSFRHKDSPSVHWSIIQSSPVFNDKGAVEYVVNIIHDITEQKLAEQQKDMFLGIASHELKTPLASIKAFTQLTKRHLLKGDDTSAIDYMGRIESKVDEITKIINDLRDLAKIKAGMLEYEPEVFNFAELLRDIIDDFKTLIKTHSIVLEGKADTLVIADRLRLKQVVTNLIKNAIKYSPGADKVIVRCEREGKHIKVEIVDFGIGVPENTKDKIFQPFYRAENADKVGGLGIGLYISSEIINYHQGELSVTSNVHKGSTFSFTLPVKPHKA